MPTPTRKKLTTTAIARKNYLVLIAKNLNKGISIVQVEEGLRTLIGEKNVINVYFPRAEGRIYMGIANIELLNAPIYKKFVQKTHKLQDKYVHFNPHPRSLDRIAAPLEETLQEWGFKDLNIAVASIIEALENATAAPKQRIATKGEV